MTGQNIKIVNIILWIAQGLLALIFIWAGSIKLADPGQLPFPWVRDHAGLVLATGILDLLGGIGIVVPALLRFQPKLTVYAAYGIIALMVVAGIFHTSRGEGKDIGFNIFVAVVAAFVAWGRTKKVPLT
jgi:hypothetical protein